jgi:hypothetical protein
MKLKTPADSSTKTTDLDLPYSNSMTKTVPGGRTSSLQLNSQSIGEQIINSRDPLQGPIPILKNSSNFFTPE